MSVSAQACHRHTGITRRGIRGDDDKRGNERAYRKKELSFFLNCGDASLNVGGATHFTKADYLRLSDGVQFTSLSSVQDALLSVAPVADFGFLEQNLASILVNESTLSVADG